MKTRRKSIRQNAKKRGGDGPTTFRYLKSLVGKKGKAHWETKQAPNPNDSIYFLKSDSDQKLLIKFTRYQYIYEGVIPQRQLKSLKSMYDFQDIEEYFKTIPRKHAHWEVSEASNAQYNIYSLKNDSDQETITRFKMPWNGVNDSNLQSILKDIRTVYDFQDFEEYFKTLPKRSAHWDNGMIVKKAIYGGAFDYTDQFGNPLRNAPTEYKDAIQFSLIDDKTGEVIKTNFYTKELDKYSILHMFYNITDEISNKNTGKIPPSTRNPKSPSNNLSLKNRVPGPKKRV